MVHWIGPFAVVFSLLFLIMSALIGLVRRPDKLTILEAVVVGSLLFTVLFSALR